MFRAAAPIIAVACALAMAGCGEDDEPAERAATPEPAPGPAAAAGCEAVEAPEPKGEQNLPKPTTKLERGTEYVATVTTNCGDFEITLDPRRAPRTGGSFKTLADEGFFDGTTFHRIAAGFVIQGGDPLGTGSGGPGYSIVEAPPADIKYENGVVAMAKTATEEPGTSGSQFFVVTAEDAQLPADYALLGRVTAGMEVVDRIASVETDPATEQPLEPIVMESVAVAEQ
jgi:peptidyl-prolyl cis-trans isomerase B (cyclophilin B)